MNETLFNDAIYYLHCYIPDTSKGKKHFQFQGSPDSRSHSNARVYQLALATSQASCPDQRGVLIRRCPFNGVHFTSIDTACTAVCVCACMRACACVRACVWCCTHQLATLAQ